ncbi:MAG: ABC transporter permease [Bryobacteraceae bacterium]
MFLRDFGRDVQHAFRYFRLRPTPALLAMAALALGIGVSTAIFSIFNAVMVQSLPYRDPDRLVMLWNVNERAGFDLKQQKVMGRSLSVAEYLDWRDRSGVFEKMIMFGSYSARISKTDDPEMVFAYTLAPGGLEMLGVHPMIGRLFSPEEDKFGGSLAIVLQYDFWKRRFHGDPRVVGQKLWINNQPALIAGVMRPDFVFFNRQIDFLASPLWRANDPVENEKRRGQRFHRAMARLKPGLSLSEAQARADAFSATMARMHPETNQNWHVKLVPIAEDSAGELRPAMMVLLAAVACVLLITCANVTNLLLVQASARARELAIRSSLGAGRFRLIRQLLTESLVLATTGGALGFGLAWAIVHYFQSVRPDRFTHGKYLLQVEALRMDPVVLLFAAAVTLVSALVFGLIPGLRASRLDTNESLKDSTRGSTGGRGGRRTRNALVITEVTVAVVLVIGAVLLLRSFLTLFGRGPGFDPSHLAFVEVAPSWEDIDDQIKSKGLKGKDADAAFTAASRSFKDRLYRQLAGIPGLDAFTVAAVIPLSSYYNLVEFTIEGRAPLPKGHGPQGIWNIVHSNYFSVMKIPLLRGHAFGPMERPGGPKAAIVGQEFARRYFDGQDPIGKRVRNEFDGSGDPWATIVGIAGDIREDGMDRPPQPYVYFCEEQYWFPSYLIIKSSRDPMLLVPAVTRIVKQVDHRAAIYRVLRLSDVVRNSAWRLNYSMLLVVAPASIAFVLAILGVYGVLSYSVRERTQEIGLRMALGADAARVTRLVTGEGIALVSIGLFAGLVIAGLLTRFLQTLLFGVRPVDPLTFGAVAITLLAAGAAASYLPAHRAANLDPATALRHE